MSEKVIIMSEKSIKAANPDRKPYLDFLRAVSCIGVIVLHVAAVSWWGADETSEEWQIANVYHDIFRWVVPMFLMISGVLFLNPLKQISLKLMLKKYIFRVAVATLIFIIIIYVAVSWELGLRFGLKKAMTYYNLWYLYMVMGLYLAVPLIRIITNNITKKQYEVLLMVLFVFSTFLPFIINFLPPFFHYFVLKAYFPLGGYVIYFLLGYYLDKYGFRHKKIAYVLALFSFALMIVGTYLLSIHNDRPMDNFITYLTPQTFFEALAVFVFVKGAYNRISRWRLLNRIIAFVSKYSLGVYGVHVIFIVLLGKAGINNSMFDTALSIPLIVVMVLGLSLILVWLLTRIPLLRRFLL
jgi:surface polysaccharide O-acyltransferase-like enzyme